MPKIFHAMRALGLVLALAPAIWLIGPGNRSSAQNPDAVAGDPQQQTENQPAAGAAAGGAGLDRSYGEYGAGPGLGGGEDYGGEAGAGGYG